MFADGKCWFYGRKLSFSGDALAEPEKRMFAPKKSAFPVRKRNVSI